MKMTLYVCAGSLAVGCMLMLVWFSEYFDSPETTAADALMDTSEAAFVVAVLAAAVATGLALLRLALALRRQHVASDSSTDNTS